MAYPLCPLTERWAQALTVSQRMFDLGLYFETHEYLEAHWMREQGARRRALQGLIQVAAGLHKLRSEPQAREGAAYLVERGKEKLDSAPGPLGLEVSRELSRRLSPLSGLIRSGRFSWERLPRLCWRP